MRLYKYYILIIVLAFVGCKNNADQAKLTVTVLGEGKVLPSQGVFDIDEVVTVIATPDSGWKFSHWSGDLSGSDISVSVTMSHDKSIKAHFTILGSTFEGEILKSSVVGGSLNESFCDIIRTVDGGFLCVGSAQSSDSDILAPSNGESDYLIIKYNSQLDVEWTKNYGGSSKDLARRVLQTSDGGFLVSGYTKSDDFDISINHGKKDFWLIKLDVDGDLMWEKSHGYPGDDESFSIIETQDGGFFTCGYIDVTESNGGGNDGITSIPSDKTVLHGIGDFWGIKLTADGEYIWRRYFGGFNNDKGYDVQQTPNGDFIIAGASESVDVDITDPKGSYDIWVIRISNDGDLVWEKNFGGSNKEECYKIIPTTDGNYFVLGNTRSNDKDVSFNHGFADLWLIKITPEGVLIWEKTYGGNQFDSASSIILLDDGNYLISGNTRSDDIYEIKGQNDILLIKINPNGDIISQYTFGGSDIDVASDVVETMDNTIIVIGSSESNDFDFNANYGFTDAFIMEVK